MYKNLITVILHNVSNQWPCFKSLKLYRKVINCLDTAYIILMSKTLIRHILHWSEPFLHFLDPHKNRNWWKTTSFTILVISASNMTRFYHSSLVIREPPDTSLIQVSTSMQSRNLNYSWYICLQPLITQTNTSL